MNQEKLIDNLKKIQNKVDRGTFGRMKPLY